MIYDFFHDLFQNAFNIRFLGVSIVWYFAYLDIGILFYFFSRLFEKKQHISFLFRFFSFFVLLIPLWFDPIYKMLLINFKSRILHYNHERITEERISGIAKINYIEEKERRDFQDNPIDFEPISPEVEALLYGSSDEKVDEHDQP